MDFEQVLQTLKERASSQKQTLLTEEATKNALVMPMLKALGYDVFNPLEVVPEFTADVGIKKGEKVDYAIFNNGKPIILFECKMIGTPLRQVQANQLYRYFTATEARFSVLTDGVRYEFYSDLDEKNRMDKRPFFIFDLENYSEAEIRELRQFEKSKYSEETILSTANDLKHGRAIEAWLKEEFANPSEEFARLAGSRVYDGRMTASVTEWFGGLLKKAIDRTIRTRVRENLQSALERGNDETGSSSNTSADQTPPTMDENGIVTTSEEIEGHRIIRAILSEYVEPDRVTMRDAKSYCAILLDDNNRKPICRLRFETKQWRVGTFTDKSETLNDIQRLSDIYALRTQLVTAIAEYDGQPYGT